MPSSVDTKLKACPDEVVGGAGAGEADVLLREAGLGADVLDHRHEHLDLVEDGLAPDVLHLGEGDDGDVPHHVTPAPGWTTSTSGSSIGRKYLMLSRFGRQVGVVDPHRLEPHADADVLHVDLLEEAHHRQVGAVEEDEAGGVRDLHALAVEGHVHDAEAGERAGVGQLDLLGGGHAQLGVGAAGRDVDLPARRPLAEDLPLGDARAGTGWWRRRRCTCTPCGRACGRERTSSTPWSFSGSVMSAIRPRAPSSRGRGWSPRARRPSAAAPACRWPWRRASRRRPVWRKPTSAPSGCTSAQAKGCCSGCFGIGSRTQAQVSTVPPGPTSTSSVSSSPVMRVVLGRRHEHLAVGALDPQEHLLAQAGEEGPDHRAGGAGERVLDDEGRAEHPGVVSHAAPRGARRR